jgi:lysophospholipase L1-like esterase
MLILRCVTALRMSVLAFLLFFTRHVVAAQADAWIATWAASPQRTAPGSKQPLLHVENQTVRERVRISLGGPQIRIRFSNEYGASPLRIGSATVALPTNPATITTSSIHALTFGGRNSVMIPPGAPALSDAVAFPLSSGAEISISIYFPDRVATPTLHWLALKRAIISKQGDHTRDETIDPSAQSESSIAITSVLVPAQPSQSVIVAFDGDGSTLDADANWPSDFARRIAATHDASKLAIVNEGVIGNRLLADCFFLAVGCLSVSALARFDRDALAIPGVTHIVLLEGVNDIGFPGATLGNQLLADAAAAPGTADLIGAYMQLISRAHARGVKLIAATIMPFEGVEVPGYYSESKEAVRQALNKWIRTSGAFDGLIDFDAVLRDPNHPTQLLLKFASLDHLHPDDAGYRALADSIDLALFR